MTTVQALLNFQVLSDNTPRQNLTKYMCYSKCMKKKIDEKINDLGPS